MYEILLFYSLCRSAQCWCIFYDTSIFVMCFQFFKAFSSVLLKHTLIQELRRTSGIVSDVGTWKKGITISVMLDFNPLFGMTCALESINETFESNFLYLLSFQMDS